MASVRPARPTRPWIGLLLVGMLLAGLAMPACAVVTLDDLDWTDITWASYDPGTDVPGGWDRAALLLPVRVNGAEYLFQLDTGAGNSYLNRDVADHAGLKYEVVRELDASAARTSWHGKVTDLELLGRRFENLNIVVHDLADDPARKGVEASFRIDGEAPPLVGTIGTDLLRSHCLILDLACGRAALSSRRPAVSGPETTIALWGGRPVLNLNGDVHLRALYDTGASAFSLICGQAAYESLTAEAGREWTIRTTGFQGLVDLQAADCTISLHSGLIDLPIGTLYGSELVDQVSSSSRGQVNAIVGNEVFRGRLVVIDFRKLVLVLPAP